MKIITLVVAALLYSAILCAQGPQTARSKNVAAQSVIRITSDVKAVLTYDHRTVLTLVPRQPTTIRLTPGRYVFEAVDDSGVYWSRPVLVGRDSSHLSVSFVAAARTAADNSKRTNELRRMADANEETVRGLSADFEKLTVASAERRAAEAKAMKSVEALIDTIGGLEKQLQQYTATATSQQRDAQELRSAAMPMAPPAVAQLVGLFGQIGAHRKEADAKRNALRARGVLLRMNRLTKSLSDASDAQFTSVEDAHSMVGRYDVTRDKTRGEIRVTDDSLVYADAAAGSSGARVNVSGTCSALKDVSRSGRAVSVKMLDTSTGKPVEIKIVPADGKQEDLLADIAISCPTLKL